MDSEIKPKAEPKDDVRDVELTEVEQSNILDLESELTTWKPIFEYINKIITARLTALQSTHEIAVKELKRKVLDININDLSVKTCVFFNRMDNESCSHIDVKKANTPVYWNAEEKQKYQKDSDNALCRNCKCTLKQGMKYMQSEITQSVRDAFKNKEEGI
jgi:sucrose-6-phosphate hydrolase SacC (GH32 family)